MSGLSLPTLILIHGSWHKPSCWNKVVKLIQEKSKLKCVTPNLPSTLGNPESGFKEDYYAACKAISNETDAGRDVVVVGHSYGGMVSASSIKDFIQPKDINKGRVIGLVLVTTGFCITGWTFMDPFLGHPPPAWRINKETGFAEIAQRPQQLFYHDLPADEADYWTSELTFQSMKGLAAGGEYSYSGWKDVPTWYIGGIEDQGLPILMQRLAVGVAREMGGNIVQRELQTSHSPFLSQPEETTEVILEAVEAFTGKSVERPPVRKEVSSRIKLANVRLFQPLTWFKFGLPTAFGRILGRCVIIVRGIRGLWR